MKATITKKFLVQEPVDKVWDYISNPTKIVTCMPGAAITEATDDKNYKGEVTMKFGPIKTKFAGDIEIIGLNNEERHMTIKGRGLDSKGKGSADMLLNGGVNETPEGTEASFEMEVTIIGKLAQFGSRLISDVTDQVMDQFIANFRNKLKGEEVDNTLSAGSIVKGLFTKKK